MKINFIEKAVPTIRGGNQITIRHHYIIKIHLITHNPSLDFVITVHLLFTISMGNKILFNGLFVTILYFS